MPAVCRGDGVDVDVFHCSIPSRLGRSSNVKVNGIGISRQGDNNTIHKKPAGKGPCIFHSAPIASGSSSVFINGRGCGRINDDISGCTRVGSGSSNVFAGG